MVLLPDADVIDTFWATDILCAVTVLSHSCLHGLAWEVLARSEYLISGGASDVDCMYDSVLRPPSYYVQFRCSVRKRISQRIR